MTNEEMTERLVEVEQRSKSNTHRLDAVEKNQEALNSIATSVAVMAEQQKNISDKVDTMDARVDTLGSKPGKRWESLVDKRLFAVAGAVLGWLAAGGPGL